MSAVLSREENCRNEGSDQTGSWTERQIPYGITYIWNPKEIESASQKQNGMVAARGWRREKHGDGGQKPPTFSSKKSEF